MKCINTTLLARFTCPAHKYFDNDSKFRKLSTRSETASHQRPLFFVQEEWRLGIVLISKMVVLSMYGMPMI